MLEEIKEQMFLLDTLKERAILRQDFDLACHLRDARDNLRKAVLLLELDSRGVARVQVINPQAIEEEWQRRRGAQQ